MPTIRNRAGHEFNCDRIGRPIPAGESEVTEDELDRLEGHFYVERVPDRPEAPEVPEVGGDETPDGDKTPADEHAADGAAGGNS